MLDPARKKSARTYWESLVVSLVAALEDVDLRVMDGRVLILAAPTILSTKVLGTKQAMQRQNVNSVANRGRLTKSDLAWH